MIQWYGYMIKLNYNINCYNVYYIVWKLQIIYVQYIYLIFYYIYIRYHSLYYRNLIYYVEDDRRWTKYNQPSSTIRKLYTILYSLGTMVFINFSTYYDYVWYGYKYITFKKYTSNLQRVNILTFWTFWDFIFLWPHFQTYHCPH